MVSVSACDQNFLHTCSVTAKEETEIREPLSHGALTSDSVYVFDFQSEVYSWYGRNSDDASREAGRSFTKVFKKELWNLVNSLQTLVKGRSKITATLFEESEKFERTVFKLKFKDWPSMTKGYSGILEVKQAGNIVSKSKEWKVYDRGCDARKVDKIDVLRMYQVSEDVTVKNTEVVDFDPAEILHRDWGWCSLRAFDFYGMNGGDDSSKVMVTLNRDAFQKLERAWDLSEALSLASDHCYMFFYSYKERPVAMTDNVLQERTKFSSAEELESMMRDCCILYLWIGSESSVSDQGIMAHAAKEVEKIVTEGTTNKPKHIRIVDGKEPEHFYNVLCGRCDPPDVSDNIKSLLQRPKNAPMPALVVRHNVSSPALLRVRGLTPTTTRIADCAGLERRYLSSGSSYIAVKSQQCCIWHGKGAATWEREAAVAAAKLYFPATSVQIVEEGDESSVWTGLFSIGDAEASSYDNFPAWSKRKTLSWKKFQNQYSSENGPAPYNVRVWRIVHGIHANPMVSEFV